MWTDVEWVMSQPRWRMMLDGLMVLGMAALAVAVAAGIASGPLATAALWALVAVLFAEGLVCRIRRHRFHLSAGAPRSDLLTEWQFLATLLGGLLVMYLRRCLGMPQYIPVPGSLPIPLLFAVVGAALVAAVAVPVGVVRPWWRPVLTAADVALVASAGLLVASRFCVAQGTALADVLGRAGFCSFSMGGFLSSAVFVSWMLAEAQAGAGPRGDKSRPDT